MTDFFLDEPILLDRSQLERYTECPRQARFIDTGKVAWRKFALESGNADHGVLSTVITEYVESEGRMGVNDLNDRMVELMALTRPDLQPDAIDGLRRSTWKISKYIHNLHHENIRRWDGGPKSDRLGYNRSGQLSHDFDDLGVRVTSEIDLIHDGPSLEVIHEVDWKSGHEKWTADKVSEAFQFCLHGMLLLHTFPEIKAANIRIWNTRINEVTYSVLFKRANLIYYEGRVRRAVEEYLKWKDKQPEETEPWPMIERCPDCPAAAICDCSGMPNITPEQIVDKLAGMQFTLMALESLAETHVRHTGKDIITPAGNCYGLSKPKRATSPKMAMYSKKQEPEE